jgi:hypothetical protein
LESALSPHPLPHPSHLTCFGAGSSFPLICSSWLGSSAPGTVHTLVDWWQQDPLLFTHLIHCPPCSMFTPLWNTHSSGASMPLVTPWETPSTLGEYLTCPPLGNPVAIQGSTTFTLRCPAGSCPGMGPLSLITAEHPFQMGLVCHLTSGAPLVCGHLLLLLGPMPCNVFLLFRCWLNLLVMDHYLGSLRLEGPYFCYLTGFLF